jgi:hypothetical protein
MWQATHTGNKAAASETFTLARVEFTKGTRWLTVKNFSRAEPVISAVSPRTWASRAAGSDAQHEKLNGPALGADGVSFPPLLVARHNPASRRSGFFSHRVALAVAEPSGDGGLSEPEGIGVVAALPEPSQALRQAAGGPPDGHGAFGSSSNIDLSEGGPRQLCI